MKQVTWVGLILMLGGMEGSLESWKWYVRASNAPADPTDVTVEALEKWNESRPYYICVRDYSILRQGVGQTDGRTPTLYFGLCPESGESTVYAAIQMTQAEYLERQGSIEFLPLVGVLHPPAYTGLIARQMRNEWAGVDPSKLWRLDLNAKPMPAQTLLIWLTGFVTLFVCGATLAAVTFQLSLGAVGLGLASLLYLKGLCFYPLVWLGLTPPRARLPVGALAAGLGMFAAFWAILQSRSLGQLAAASDWELMWRIGAIDAGLAATVIGLLLVVSTPGEEATSPVGQSPPTDATLAHSWSTNQDLPSTTESDRRVPSPGPRSEPQPHNNIGPWRA